MTMSIDAIIVAAGSGSRLGAQLPKAFVPLGGKPLFMHSVLLFEKHLSIEKIIIVVPALMIDETKSICSLQNLCKPVEIVAGGKERWQSVQNGTKLSHADWVMIHDCARPFLTIKLIDEIISVSKTFDAVIAATLEVDTIRIFNGNVALETLDRNKIIRVQTPQMFRRNSLENGFSHAATMVIPPTDEAMLMQTLNIPIGIAWGDSMNFKVTTQADLALAEAFCEKQLP
jgi:2-C-methyl-D-erythritol 4-phosphate cytidylyltransferase